MSNSEIKNFFDKLKAEELSFKKDFKNNSYLKKINRERNLVRQYLREIVKDLREMNKGAELGANSTNNVGQTSLTERQTGFSASSKTKRQGLEQMEIDDIQTKQNVGHSNYYPTSSQTHQKRWRSWPFGSLLQNS